MSICTARALVLLCLLICLPKFALAGPAEESLKVRVNEVLNILASSKPGVPGRTDRLAAVLKKIFDPEELARLTLASHWEAFTPEQRIRFASCFENLLEQTYLRHMATFTKAQVIFLDEASLGEGRSEVSTRIIASTGDLPIVYRFSDKNGWKVYDVLIEGVSLVQNYRSQFNQILSKESPAQLIVRVESMVVANKL
jgi:phospholipid transport system substrate-binding protein